MGTEPVGEIRGGLHDELSHSDVGPKITNKTGTPTTVTTDFLKGV